MERQRSGYSNQPQQRHRSHRPSGSYSHDLISVPQRRLNQMSNVKLFLLAILAGAFICAAGLLSLLLTDGIVSYGLQSVLAGLGLSFGFLLVILSNSVLFTEPNIYVTSNFYNRTLFQNWLRLFRFWLIAWIGNLIGAFLFAFLVYLAQDYSDNFKQILISLSAMKLKYNLGYRGAGELLISGILANWIVAFSSIFIVNSRNIINQFIISFLTFIFIAATNFQYFLINAAYFSLNAFLSKSISLFDAIFFNLIPVSLGNLIGGGLLVALPLLFMNKKSKSQTR